MLLLFAELWKMESCAHYSSCQMCNLNIKHSLEYPAPAAYSVSTWLYHISNSTCSNLNAYFFIPNSRPLSVFYILVNEIYFPPNLASK